MYSIEIGSISAARIKNWNNGDDNPYGVIEGKPLYSKTCDIYGISDCKKHLREEVPIDWGSWAFKGNNLEIEALFKDLCFEFELLEQSIEEGRDYAVVFIEET